MTAFVGRFGEVGLAKEVTLGTAVPTPAFFRRFTDFNFSADIALLIGKGISGIADVNVKTAQGAGQLKGGKIKSKTGIKDYALFRHMYIDRQELIGCFICKMRWRPRDTKEYLVRDGRKIRNHTKIGWLEACELFEQSSNSVTSSEIPISSRQDEFDGAEDIGPAEAQ